MFLKRLKTCFQSKSQVSSWGPQRVLNKGSDERMLYSLLPSCSLSQRVSLISAARRRESPSEAMQYKLLSSPTPDCRASAAACRSCCWSLTVSRLQLPLMTKGLAAYSDGTPDKMDAAMTVAYCSFSKYSTASTPFFAPLSPSEHLLSSGNQEGYLPGIQSETPKNI